MGSLASDCFFHGHVDYFNLERLSLHGLLAKVLEAYGKRAILVLRRLVPVGGLKSKVK